MSEIETVQIAAARAATRWRYIAGGLAVVAFTNVINLALNTAALDKPGGYTCIAVIGDKALAETLAKERAALGDSVHVAR